MPVTTWRDIDDDKRMELLARRYLRGETPARLAWEVGIPNPITLNRRLQKLRQDVGEDMNLEEWLPEEEAPTGPMIEFPKEKPPPANEALYKFLKNGPRTLKDISKKFDRSQETVLAMIERMEEAGYVFEKTERTVKIDLKRPVGGFSPAGTLLDEIGHEILFAVVSDPHAGSTCAQPSNMNKFIQTAYDEGVRHFLMPGDLTAGIYGYRGQDYDLIPSATPFSRTMAHVATRNQVWLADAYLPKLDGAMYYVLGGNHDYWHIKNAGIDAVAMFCRQRDDAVFLGYDVADIPLAERASVRLWHPSGGVAYALSYKLQKGLENLAFDELTNAIELNTLPKVRFLISGHLHLENKFRRGPMIAALAGAFEGQTNYLKQKGLYPTIGGSIWKVRLTETGLVQREQYEFIPFTEIIDDWRNFPEPDTYDVVEPAEKVETLFELREIE